MTVTDLQIFQEKVQIFFGQNLTGQAMQYFIQIKFLHLLENMLFFQQEKELYKHDFMTESV